MTQGRIYTAGQIIDRAARKADMYNSEFISSEEAMDLLNESYAELYDLLVTKYEEYYIKDNVFIELQPGTYSYDLPDDFYKGVGVDYQLNLTGTGYVTLRPFTEMERNGTTGVLANIPTGRVKLRYVPLPPIYTSRSDEINGISGWETLMVVNMAISMLSKEESDTSALERQKAQLMQRINIAGQNRDTGFPAKVNDIYKVNVYEQYATLRYQYTGDKIKFISTQVIDFSYLGIYM